MTQIINECSRDIIASFPDFKPMFDIQYADYLPNALVIQAVKARLTGTKVTIVMGMWCIDSKLQVPHFFRILDEAGVSESEITLICVDEHKRTTDGSTDHLNVERVPTFIVSRNGAELGRIVEFPLDTLEEDLLAILSSK